MLKTVVVSVVASAIVSVATVLIVLHVTTGPDLAAQVEEQRLDIRSLTIKASVAEETLKTHDKQIDELDEISVREHESGRDGEQSFAEADKYMREHPNAKIPTSAEIEPWFCYQGHDCFATMDLCEHDDKSRELECKPQDHAWCGGLKGDECYGSEDSCLSRNTELNKDPTRSASVVVCTQR